jgi:hypothetical protein
MEDMFTNKNNRKKKKKMYLRVSKGHTGEMFLTLSRIGNTRILKCGKILVGVR